MEWLIIGWLWFFGGIALCAAIAIKEDAPLSRTEWVALMGVWWLLLPFCLAWSGWEILNSDQK